MGSSPKVSTELVNATVHLFRLVRVAGSVVWAQNLRTAVWLILGKFTRARSDNDK